MAEMKYKVYCDGKLIAEFEKAFDQMHPSLKPMKKLADDGCQVIITYPNNDPGGKRIIQEIE